MSEETEEILELLLSPEAVSAAVERMSQYLDPHFSPTAGDLRKDMWDAIYAAANQAELVEE